MVAGMWWWSWDGQSVVLVVVVVVVVEVGVMVSNLQKVCKIIQFSKKKSKLILIGGVARADKR